MSLILSQLEKARHSGGKIIARCPACAETGDDTSAEHLFINADGKFGCVLYQSTDGAEHRKRIFELVGDGESKPTGEKSIWTALPAAPDNAPSPTLNHHELGTPSAHWTYHTAEGKIAGLIARYDTAKGKETRPKSWCKDQHGNTGWKWKSMAEPRPLYGLPIDHPECVLVEGEKCADAVRAAGLNGITWSGGSGAVLKTNWQTLAGKSVTIWPDNDKPGCDALADILQKLHPIAREIKIVKIPQGRPLGWDAADTDDFEINQLVSEAEIYASKDKTPEPFPITRAGLSAGMAMAADFVESLLTEGGASVIYGPSNCGKSFWILDIAVAVATGKDFRDELEVDQGAVVYVALEGSFGMQNRIEALKRAGRLPDDAPLFMCYAPVSLLEVGHAGRLAESVKQAAAESSLPCRLVIIDTMARAMAGGDENAGKDMTAAVASIDAIRAATGAHVAIVHHCGKDEARGARGHSSLRAAVDTEIEVSRPEGETITTVRITKQRDLPIGGAMPFSLESITLGTDRRGKPVTSCVVRHEDEMMAAKPGKAGRKPICTPEEMLVYLPASSVKEWQAKVAEETGLGRSQFYDHKKQLEAGNRFRKTSTGIQAA